MFCCGLGQPHKIPSKRILPIPMYTYFDNLYPFLTIKKSIIGINTFTLTPNENRIFNHKKHHSNKCIALKPNKKHILTISNYKKSTVGINTYTLTLNENLILTIFNYKKSTIVINAYALTLYENLIF